MAPERQQKGKVPSPFLTPIGFWQNYPMNHIEANSGKSEISKGLMKILQEDTRNDQY
jgi:hypothetical protein